MRFYRLTLNSPTRLLVLDANNPWGLDISFSQQGTSDAASVIPSVIEIINAPLDVFTRENLKNAFIILEAGVLECGLTKAQRIKTPLFNSPLITGVVGNSFSQWELTDTRISLQINAASYRKTQVTFTLNPGDIISTVVAAYLTQLYSATTGLIFVIDPLSYCITYQSTSSTTFNYSDYTDAKNIVKQVKIFIEKFGLSIGCNNNIYCIYNKKFGITPGVLGTLQQIDKTQMLTQPTMTDAVSVSIEVALNPNITLGSIINLPYDVPLYSGSLLGDIKSVILKEALQTRILKAGNYTVTEVMHRGESRNPDPRAWSTNIKCIPSGGF